jgi:hypothetical protein
MRAAEDALGRMNNELKAQEERSRIMRSYDKTKELAAEVKTAGQKARSDAEAGKERAKQEASQALADARTKLADTRALLDQAPTGKGTTTDIAAMKATLDGVEQSLAGVEHTFSAGRYNEARTQAQAAMQSSEQIRAEIETAIAEREAAKGRRRG